MAYLLYYYSSELQSKGQPSALRDNFNKIEI